jgi:hypothetical protein
VSCSSPFNALINFDASGNLGATPFAVHTGTVGPPAAGTDSAGHDAATDAALYPCPPTAAQLAAGDTCQIALADLAAHRATKDIAFQGQGGTTTTTAGPTSTTTSTAPTTTTTAHATTTTTAHATTTTTTHATTTSTTAPPARSITVSPSTGLTDGAATNVSGAGFSPGLGVILQCNNDPGQPTIAVSGNPVPVSCSSPFNALINFDASGNLSATPFVVHTGTVGPPSAGTDSAGHDAAADAALYPCPPTAAQLAAGDTCQIALADLAAHQVTKDITFVGQVVPTTSTTIAGTTTTTAGPSVSANTASTSPGGSVTLSGSGFPNGSTLSVTFLSTPVQLGTVTADGKGAFQVAVTIPSDATLGTHHIQVATADGAVKVSIPIEIVAPGTPAASTTSTAAAQVLGTQTTNSALAFTGSSATTWLMIGLFSLLLGAMLVFNTRPLRAAARRR